MRVVQIAEDGVMELNWMWLPTFIGQNHGLQQQLGMAWKEQWPEGFIYTDAMLDEVHRFTVAWFAKKIPIKGLAEYLDGIRNVQDEEEEDVVSEGAS